jgi:rhamnulokinase
MPQHYLAFDLGASSGRAVIGTFDGATLALEECHRFPNRIIRVLDHLHWDLLGLFEQMQEGLTLCARSGRAIHSIGVDTWGVDFALLGRNMTLLGMPYAYRDPHTIGIMESAFELAGRQEIFDQTGIQFMPINTLYHLIALARAGSPLLESAEKLLMIPDVLNLFLTGVAAAEFTDVTTTQCFNPVTSDWAWPLLERFNIPTQIMPDVIQPGTVLGTLLPHIAHDTGLGQVSVVAPASHDTASAVAAVPAHGKDWAYLSSGTWSLMGIETSDPIISPKAMALNFTNEGGVGGTYRVLKNITGLWLIQECQRIWAREGEELDFGEITRQADQSMPFKAFINPDDPAFTAPENMPKAIAQSCATSGQSLPSGIGAMARCIFESLALKHRLVIDQLHELRGRPLEMLHIVGGGARNKLLCQFTSNATGIPVRTGPVEATAIGNILVQAMAHGEIADLAQLRTVVANSFELGTLEPSDTERWNDAYGRYLALWG